MNIDRLVMRVSVLVFLLCVAGVCLAGITSTPQAPQYLIRLADKTYEKGKTVPLTHDECLKRAAAIIPRASCVTIEDFDNAGNCDDVPKPAWEIEKDAEGFLIKPAFRSRFKEGSDTEFVHEVEDYKPAPYPTCWVKDWRTAMESDFTNEDEPKLANVDEPVVWPAALVAAWQASCPERHLHKIYYDGDECA